MVARELFDGIGRFPNYDTPSDPRLMEYYEAALVAQAVVSAEFNTRFRSLVGALIWVGPAARADVLYSAGICARAFTFATLDLYGCAVRILV